MMELPRDLFCWTNPMALSSKLLFFMRVTADQMLGTMNMTITTAIIHLVRFSVLLSLNFITLKPRTLVAR